MSRQQFLRERPTVGEDLDPTPAEIPEGVNPDAPPTIQQLIDQTIGRYLRRQVQRDEVEADEEGSLRLDGDEESEFQSPYEVKEMTEEFPVGLVEPPSEVVEPPLLEVESEPPPKSEETPK